MSTHYGESHCGDGRTYSGIHHIRGKPGANPGMQVFDYCVSGTALAEACIWPDHVGDFRILIGSRPTNYDVDGTVIGAASGATTALSNLAAVAINTSLISDTTNTDDLGSAAKAWRTGYFQTSLVLKQTTANYTLTWDNPAAARAISIPDPLGTDIFAFLAAAQAFTNKTISGATNTLSNIPLTAILNAGGAQGDVAYWSGTAWTKLTTGAAGTFLKSQGAGANPMWDTPSVGTASILAQTTVIECGGFDYTLHSNSPAAARHLDIDDPLGTDSFVFAAALQTLGTKILKTSCYFGDTAAPTKMVAVSASGATATKTATLTFIHTLDRVYTFPDAAGTVCLLDGAQTLETKTLKSTCLFGDNADAAKHLHIQLSGATTAKHTTLIFDHTDDRGITFPDATTTLVGKATTDVFTNKTLDCLGTGNVVTNVNAKELDPVTPATAILAVPFVIMAVNPGAATHVIFNANCPYKLRIINAWAVATKACAGNWKLDNGTNDITTTVAYGADTIVSRATAIDDSKHELAANATLRLISSDAADTGIVYIMAVRID